MPLPAETVGAGRVADRNNRRSSTRSSASSETATGVPRVGGVRCYWAFLRPIYPRPDVPGSKLELVFVHPDPVLGVHLAKQKMSLMGRGVIEFIHPHEREQARQDLASAIAADDLRGSVTRMRFARLSRLKLILGCAPEDIEYPEFEWQKLVVDEDYLILDLVLNWVADGMLLAFFHAATDVDPIANNDPNRRDEGWSNLCGTANIDSEQIEALHSAISQTIAPTPLSRVPPTRILQLQTPATSTAPSSLLFSWPPPRAPGSYARYDGLYDAAEYGQLMRGINMDPSTQPHIPGDVRTTCRSRFGAQHSLTSEGVYRLVGSTFIPYGNLIFACFQTVKTFDLPERHQYQPPLFAHTEWQQGGSTMESGPSGSSPADSDIFAQQQFMTPDTSHLSPPHLSSLSPSHYPAPPNSAFDSPPSFPAGPSSAPPGWSAERETYYRDAFYPNTPAPFPPPPLSAGMHPQLSDPGPPHTYHPYDQSHPDLNPILSPQHHQVSPASAHLTPASTAFSPVTPEGQIQKPDLEMDPTPPHSGSSRPLIRPPGDVDCCVACGTRESPEWRRSESGIKDLCNACGLRLARQVAKREGKQKPRKKKEK